MVNKIQIKRGSGAPAVGALDVGELGWDKINKKLYVGNGTNNPSTQINGFEYYDKSTDAQIDELLYTFINSGDLPNNDSKHIVLYVSESGCKIPANKYFIEICKSSSEYGIISAIGYDASTGPRHYMRMWVENVLQDWIDMRNLQSFGVTASTAEINKLDGVTASTTEINVLDGITASTAEINYVDGVTSSIQTQLNNKVPTSRTINGKSLTNNITLSADDVGARPSTWIPAKDDLLNIIWPVGSIYIAYHHTSPASLFGGTWYRIENRFLWGTSASGTIGATAGEQTHILTVDEMPAHTHNNKLKGGPQTASSSVYDWVSNSTAWQWYNLATESTGGGKAHNNMPPYIQVSIWRRTA